MSELTVSEARARLADVVDEARIGHEPVPDSAGRRVAAVVDSAYLDWLIEQRGLRGRRGRARGTRRDGETGEQPVPWEQVKADLGLA